MNKREKHEEELKDKFSLNQREVHLFGELILEKIARRWVGLIEEPDHCWSLDQELDLLKKLTTIVVRLQSGRILKG
jgi:hypothetical protein